MSSQKTIIEAGRAEQNYWRDLWRYRELFQVLAWRDFSVRYKQTVIGVAWAIIRPLLTMIIFTIIFGKVAKLPSTGSAPYALMVMAAMLPWTFFSTAISDSSASLIGNTNLVSKVYFPRLIMPTASIIVTFADMVFGFGIMIGVMLWYHFIPDWRIIFVPVFVVLAFLAALGPGLWVTSLTVKYRDFRYVVPFMVQFGMYVSPVGFSSAAILSSSVIPEKLHFLYWLNPMVSVIDGFRWCLLRGEAQIYWPGFLLGLGVIGLALWLGVSQFRRLERSFADLI